MSTDRIVPTPEVRVTAPCCGGWCEQLLTEYEDEPGRWWLTCPDCGHDHRLEHLDRFWEKRVDAVGDKWASCPRPELANLLDPDSSP